MSDEECALSGACSGANIEAVLLPITVAYRLFGSRFFMMLQAGALIYQRYQIVRTVGRGGMGAVYEAVDQRLNNTVALKQMLGTSDDNAVAFEREAQILAGLRHQALPKVTDYFRDPQGLFLVMEFFSGADLATLQARRGGAFPVGEVLEWADQLLAALDYLHHQQPPIVHRDIKPQNLKLTADKQVVLLDFGLAKNAADSATVAARGNSFFGYTLQYAPLEQIEGTGTEPRSDLYALAATLYHLLTDQQPANAPMRADALVNERPDPLIPLDELNPAVPPHVAQVLREALSLRRDSRPVSAAAMRAALRSSTPSLEVTVVGGDQTAQPMKRGPAVAIAHLATKTWHDVLQSSKLQSEPVLRELRGTTRRTGTFMEDVYVLRTSTEHELAAFLADEYNALLLVGESGVGKTNVLCRWACSLMEAGHVVLFYRCGGSLHHEIEREIARDLHLDAPDLLATALTQIGQLAASAGSQVVLVFDAINEFRSGAQAGPEALLKQIDALVGRVNSPHVRFVVSCNSATWGQLERAGATRLFWSSYYQVRNGDMVLRLLAFDEAEFAAAYLRYQVFFGLKTDLDALPVALRERLHKPLLLRMLAEAHRNDAVLMPTKGMGLSIFRRYYEERVRQRRDLLFVEELAGEMLRAQQITLSVRDLARNEQLRPEIVSDDPDSSYIRLLDSGILNEVSGDLFVGDAVTFTYAEVGAYVLSRHLLRNSASNEDIHTTVVGLMEQVRRFPLAWDIARTLLLVYKNSAVFAELAQSPDIELRELVVESLVELHLDDQAAATETIKQMCQSSAAEAQRTALKAAYYIGPRAHDIFLWAVSKGNPMLRRATRDALYLTWRNDPGFTYGLLDEMVARVGPGALRDLRNILESFFELSVVIYINHCERDDVKQQTIDLYYELAKHRLHLDVLNTGLFGKTIEDLIFQAVSNAFSRPILDTMMLAEIVPIDEFFSQPPAERAILKRVAPLFDPAVPLAPALDDLEALLGSRNVFFNLVAMAILAVHAYADFTTSEPLLRQIFARADGQGQVWMLLSFSVLLPATPPEWAKLIEEFTEQIFRTHPALVHNHEPTLLAQFDILLLPLGLAYSKIGQTMPALELLVQDALLRDDQQAIERCVAGLAAVGFYFPDAALRLLGLIVDNSEPAELPATLARSLATIRTLHLDTVDVFLQQRHFSDEFQRQVAALADTGLVRRYIYWLGLYNHVVHSSLFYPRIRRQLAIHALHLLAEARNPQEFIAQYTANVFRMLREAGFRLSEWTLPE